MNLNELTEKAQEAVVEAKCLAESRQNTQIEPEHLRSALLQQEGGVVPAVLDRSAFHQLGGPARRVETQPRTLRSEMGFLFVTFKKAGSGDDG